MPFWTQQPPQVVPKRRYAKNAVGNERDRDQLNFIAETLIQCVNIYQDLRTASQENYEFTEGQSWESSLKEQLQKRGITPLEINIILPRVLNVVGQYLESRGRLIAIPTQNAGVVPAEVGTKLLEWQNEVNKLYTNNTRDQEIIKALCDAVVSELGGWIEIFQDNKRDPLGIQVVQRVSPFHVFPDPSVDIDKVATQGRFVLKTSFLPVERIVSMWPDKRDEILHVTGQYTRTHWWQTLTNQWARITGAAEEMRSEFLNSKENTFRVVEMQERRYEKVTFVFDPFSGNFEGPMPKAEAKEVIKLVPELELFEDEREVIYTSISLGDWLLLDEYPNAVQNGMFSLIPLPGLSFSGKNFSPVVGQLKGVQKEYNQSRTSFLTILRSNAFGGWIYERGALSEEMEEKLEQYSASAGFNMIHEPGHPTPTRIAYQAISQGDVQRSEMSLRDAENITAIAAGTMGVPEYSGESGVLHRQRVVQAVKGQRLLFSLAENTEANVARYLLDLMNVYLQPGRTIDLVGQESKPEKLIYNDDFRLDLWKVKIIQGDQSETQRARKLAEIQSLLAMIPPDRYLNVLPLVMRALNWADVDEWIEALQLTNQIPLQFQAQMLQTLADIDQSLQGGLPEGEASPLQLEAGPTAEMMSV